MVDAKQAIIETYNSAERMFEEYTKSLDAYYDVSDAITASIYLGKMNACVELMIALYEDYSLRDRYRMIDKRVHKSEFEKVK